MAKRRRKAPYRRGFGDWCRAILKGFPVLLIAVLIGAIAGYGVSERLIGPTYTAYASLGVTRQAAKENDRAGGDEPQVISLTGEAREAEAEEVTLEGILLGEELCREVISKLKLMVDGQPMQHQRFLQMLKVDVPESVNAISRPAETEQSGTILIRVTDTVLQRAQDIAGVYLETAARELEAWPGGTITTGGADSPPETEVYAPNTKRMMLLCGLGALLLMVLLLTLLFLVDDTLRTSRDVERCLGIETIGVIPYVKSEEMTGRSGRGAKR